MDGIQDLVSNINPIGLGVGAAIGVGSGLALASMRLARQYAYPIVAGCAGSAVVVTANPELGINAVPLGVLYGLAGVIGCELPYRLLGR
ncbi:hypothetical protein HY640_03890 [Candidatus Woesearchaeota archaeon]|nr:hypothetical protein [Candidatus Woesearchaeota archaeon]